MVYFNEHFTVALSAIWFKMYTVPRKYGVLRQKLNSSEQCAVIAVKLLRLAQLCKNVFSHRREHGNPHSAWQTPQHMYRHLAGNRAQ